MSSTSRSYLNDVFTLKIFYKIVIFVHVIGERGNKHTLWSGPLLTGFPH